MHRIIRSALILTAFAAMLITVPTTHAQTADGVLWQVEYFPNFFASGSPQGGGQLGGPLAMVWRDGGPAPGIGDDGWTARFTGNAYFPAGRYRFRMLVDDGALLRVSGIDLFSTLSFDQHSLGCPIYADMTLSEGIHQVQITYLENNGDASLFFNWQPLTSFSTNDPIYHGCNPPDGGFDVTRAEADAFNANPGANASGADFSSSVYGSPQPAYTAPAATSETTTAPAAIAATSVTSVSVLVGTLNVRSVPSTSGSTVIGKVLFGQTFPVTGAADGWYEIDYNGQVGYVSSRYVRTN